MRFFMINVRIGIKHKKIFLCEFCFFPDFLPEKASVNMLRGKSAMDHNNTVYRLFKSVKGSKNVSLMLFFDADVVTKSLHGL